MTAEQYGQLFESGQGDVPLKCWEAGFFVAVMDAQKRWFLERAKRERPDEKIVGPFDDYGFVPSSCHEFNPLMDIERWIQDRRQARERKDWALADEIKRKVLRSGYEIMEGREGAGWVLW